MYKDDLFCTDVKTKKLGECQIQFFSLHYLDPYVEFIYGLTLRSFVRTNLVNLSLPLHEEITFY